MRIKIIYGGGWVMQTTIPVMSTDAATAYVTATYKGALGFTYIKDEDNSLFSKTLNK